MRIPTIKNVKKILIMPKSTLFNPKRVVYEIGQTTMYADAGKGAVHLGQNGTVYADGLKNLGICTLGNGFAAKQRIIVKNSNIATMSLRANDIITFYSCKFPEPKSSVEKFNHIAEVIYTNRK